MLISRASACLSRGKDSSPEASRGERGKSHDHMGDFMSFLSRDVLPMEDRRISSPF